MVDLTSISAALSSVKTATEIAKLIKDSDASLADAETKLKIAELISALADTKIELAEIQDTIRDKEIAINSLEKQLQEQQKVSFSRGLYWAEEDSTPFCPVCFENDKKCIHLIHHESTQDYSGYFHCKVCTNSFEE